MTLWAQIDVALLRDAKIREAGPMARLLYIQTILWSRENLTDGQVDPVFIRDVAVDIRSPRKHFDTLVTVGLMEQTDTNGYRIPRKVWAKWSPTRRELDAERRRKSSSGKRGAHARWHSSETPNDDCQECHDAGYLGERAELVDNSDAKPMAGAIGGAIGVPWQVPCDSDATSMRLDGQSSERQSSERQSSESSSSLQGDPYPVPSPVDDDDDDEPARRRTAILDRIAHNRTSRANPRHPTAYRATVRRQLDLEKGSTIDRLLREHPHAPDSAIADAVDADEPFRLHRYG